MAMLLSSVGCRSAAIQYESVAANVSFDQVQTLPVREATVRVSYGDAPTQFAELWLPTDQEEKSPVLVLVHGGCWLNSFGIDHTKAMSTALMQSGFAVWNLEYRRLGDEGGGWPGSFEDIQAGIVRLTELDSDLVGGADLLQSQMLDLLQG